MVVAFVFAKWHERHAALAGSLDSIRLLVEHGAELDSSDRAFGRPLECAAATGHRDAVELLLQLGADPALLDEDGRLPNWKGPAVDPEVKAGIEAMLERREQ